MKFSRLNILLTSAALMLPAANLAAQSVTGGFTRAEPRSASGPSEQEQAEAQARQEAQQQAQQRAQQDGQDPDLAQQMGVPPISDPGEAQQGATMNSVPNVGPRGEEEYRELIDNDLITDNRGATSDRIDGFNQAIEELFPMTPEMIERMRQIESETERAIRERPEPEAVIGSEVVSLEPGAQPPVLNVAPGIASVISIYDVTGNPWPIDQYVIGNGEEFQILQLGEDSNGLTVTPLENVGWTNIVLRLADEATPVVLRVNIDQGRAHYRHDLQVLGHGPDSQVTTASAGDDYDFLRPGDDTLMAVLTNVDLPDHARPVPISGVSASAYEIDDAIYIRSRHALLSPSWTGSMAGPNGTRVYRIDKTGVALFSVDGQIIRADLEAYQ